MIFSKDRLPEYGDHSDPATFDRILLEVGCDPKVQYRPAQIARPWDGSPPQFGKYLWWDETCCCWPARHLSTDEHTEYSCLPW
jgi:hypothetical protein